MSTARRGFLAGILAAGFAPAAIGSGILMPVRSRIVLPTNGLTKARALAAVEILRAAERAANPPVVIMPPWMHADLGRPAYAHGCRVVVM